AHALTILGLLKLLQGKRSEVRPHLDEALALFREAGGLLTGKWGLDHSLLSSGLAYNEVSNYEAGRAHLDEALALFREVKDKWGVAQTLNGLGDAARITRHYPRAWAFYEESLALYRQLGTRADIAAARHHLGY